MWCYVGVVYIMYYLNMFNTSRLDKVQQALHQAVMVYFDNKVIREFILKTFLLLEVI